MVNKKSSPAVACTLPSPELRRRRKELLPGLLTRAKQVIDLENGLRLRFAARPGLLIELARIVEQEQICCSFLSFQLSTKPGRSGITLEVTGPPGTREMLREL